MSRPTLLVLCLDGADLDGYNNCGADLRVLPRLLSHRRPLPSTLIPQTPVAWTSFICGAEPRETGVWGWTSPRSLTRPLGMADLPTGWSGWPGPFLVGGLPLFENVVGEWGVAIGGLRGPTKQAGGSRPHLPFGLGIPEAASRWRAHHDQWAQRLSEAAAGMRLVFAHCDVVDWFSHRYGPDHRAASAAAWSLADSFAGRLVESIAPEHTLVLSDHGSAGLQAFVLIHDLFHDAGLSERPAAGLVSMTDLFAEPIHCRNEYGAVWCPDPGRRQTATGVLLAAGATEVLALTGRKERRIDLERGPDLVAVFPDGWITLVPPALYPPPGTTGAPVVRSGPLFSRLREENWHGDHARTGMLGSDSAELFACTAGLAIPALREQISAWLKAN